MMNAKIEGARIGELLAGFCSMYTLSIGIVWGCI